MLKVGDQVLAISGPYPGEICVVCQINWTYAFPYTCKDLTSSRTSIYLEEELVLIPKEATSDQIKALKSLLCLK